MSRVLSLVLYWLVVVALITLIVDPPVRVVVP